MQWTPKLSLRRKITLVIMINTVAALCAAGIAFAEYGAYRFKELRLEDLNALANILGTNSTAPLALEIPTPRRTTCGPSWPNRTFYRLSFTTAKVSPLPFIIAADRWRNIPRRPWKSNPAGLPPTVF